MPPRAWVVVLEENLESCLESALLARDGLAAAMPSALAPPLPAFARARAKISFNFASRAETFSELRMLDTEGRMVPLGVFGAENPAMPPMLVALLLADIVRRGVPPAMLVRNDCKMSLTVRLTLRLESCCCWSWAVSLRCRSTARGSVTTVCTRIRTLPEECVKTPKRFSAEAVLFTESTKCSSFRYAALPRKKSCIWSRMRPTGRHVRISRSWLPGWSDKWWKP
mmetsp:Transcript_41401/g.71754  ORF Transcript_41401/g.71754 Transcript_41401/m.71754 type:complete len:225 (+) Transcript_41401:70-744(+)